MSHPLRRAAPVALSLCLLACGARSGLGEIDRDTAVAIDAGPRDPGRDAGPERDPLLGVWYFGLTSGALRYYAVAICPDGRTFLRTSLNGDGLPDVDGVRDGYIVSRDSTRALVYMDVHPNLVMEFQTMNVRYVEATDTLFWEEEADVFPGWASGGGVRQRPAFVPGDFLACDD